MNLNLQQSKPYVALQNGMYCKMIVMDSSVNFSDQLKVKLSNICSLVSCPTCTWIECPLRQL